MTSGKHEPLIPKSTFDAPAFEGIRARGQRLREQYDSFFMKHRNPIFASDAKLAVRAAVVVVMSGMPFVPNWFFGQGAVVMFLFTVWKSVGETIFLAWCCVAGNLVAALNMEFLNRVLIPPGNGFEVSNITFFIILANSVCFVVLICCINMHVATQQFALANFVIYWMTTLAGKSVVPLVRQNVTWALIGCTFAILVTLIPTPLWSLDVARSNSRMLGKKSSVAWRAAVELYCSEDFDEYFKSRLEAKLAGMRGMIQQLEKQIQNSWYESFGMRDRIRTRRMLAKFDKLLKETSERMFSVCALCLCENFSPIHDAMAALIRPSAQQVVQNATALVTDAIEVACAGSATDEQANNLRNGIGATLKAVTEFSQVFKQSRETVTGFGQDSSIRSELLEEHAFGINLCAFGRLSFEFAESLLEVTHGGGDDVPTKTATLLEVVDAFGLCKVLDRKKIFQWENLRHGLRNAMTILFGFALGYDGFGGFLPPRNPGIANTVALLMSPSDKLGSALKKNLDRISGVVLGTVVGQMCCAIFRQCTLASQGVLGVILASWVEITLFVRYHSPTYSMIGKLLSAFGAKNMLAGCSTAPFHASQAYTVIINTTLSVLVFVFVDFASWEERASQGAHEAMVAVWESLAKDALRILSPSTARIARPAKSTIQLIKRAETLGREAAAEPRYWRVPWREQTFNLTLKCSSELNSLLTMIEYSLTGGVLDDALAAAPGNVDSDMDQIMHLPAFAPVRSVFYTEICKLKTKLGIFVHEGSEPWPVLEARVVTGSDRTLEVDSRRRCIEEANRLRIRAKSMGASTWTLEEDTLAKASVMLVGIDIMMLEMKALHQTILKE